MLYTENFVMHYYCMFSFADPVTYVFVTFILAKITYFLLVAAILDFHS